MRVQDDGPGFDLTKARARGGLGLVLIEVLTAQIKGTNDLETKDGSNGTQETAYPAAGAVWKLCFPCLECRIAG